VQFPVYLTVGPWHLHPHLVLESLGYGVGFYAYLRRRRRQGDHLGDEARWSIVTAAVVGAVIGSRLLFWLEDPAATAAAMRDGQWLAPGKTLVGALAGGWIAVELLKKRLHITAATGDLFAVPLAAGIAVGRVGCFLTGLPDGTYGTPSSLPWAIDLGDAVPRHPTALYEAFFMAGLAAVLEAAERTGRRGDAFKMFMASYLAFRLVVDTIKPGVRIALGLTAIQWTCAAGLVYCAWWFVQREPASQAPAAAIAPQESE
jgi:phosphatidylglycerol---prolipoprotein diacylglyceryl transferase